MGRAGLAADRRVSGVCHASVQRREEERKGKDSNSDDLGRTWWKLPTVLDTEKTSVISSLF